MWKIMNGYKRRTVLDTANEMLREIAVEYQISALALRGAKRSADIVAARRAFCVRGRADRIQTKVLAAALNCHHTTVTYHSNTAYRLNKNARRPKRAAEGNQYDRSQTEKGQRQRDGQALARCSPALRTRHQPPARSILGELDGPC